MDASMESLILTELQELRSDLRDFRGAVGNWKVEVTSILTEHDTKIKDVSGNGQPGRMADAESDIAGLKRDRWWAVGWATGVGGLLGCILEIARMRVGH